MGPRVWQPLFRCRTVVQVCGVFWEIPSGNVPVFSACWFDSGHKFASVYGALSHFSAMLGSTVDTNLRQSTVLFRIPRNAWIDSGYKFASVYGSLSYFSAMLGSAVDTTCVSLRSSFVFQRNAWFDSGYKFASVYGTLSYFSAMLGSTVDIYCRARRRVGSGMAFAGLLVTMISRCVHFVVGRPVESSQVQQLRQFQLLALPSGMRSRLLGALCIGTAPGGHVHRDMTTIIRCIRAVVSTKTLLLYLVRTTTTTTHTHPLPHSSPFPPHPTPLHSTPLPHTTTTTQGSTRLHSFG